MDGLNMLTINITNARNDLYNLVDKINFYNEPALIVGKKGNAVLISEKDWKAIKEAIGLNENSDIYTAIQEGMNTPVKDCIPEEKVKW